MKTITIPGGTVSLREQSELKVRHEQLVESAVVAAAGALSKLPDDQEQLETTDITTMGLTRQEASALFELQDAKIVVALDSWTRSESLPTMDTIGDLEPDVYKALAEAVRDLGNDATPRVDFSPTNPRAPGFDQSPTSPSDGSAAVSRADQVSPSTGTSADTGESTDTVHPIQG